MKTTPNKKFLDFILYLLLFAVALGCRSFFFHAHGVTHVFGKYLYFADQLAQGFDLGQRFLDLSPFYLYFITFATKYLGFGVAHLEIFQLFLGVVNCVLIFAIGKRLFSRLAAFVGALAYAGYGNMMVLESTFEPLIFLMVFNLLCILFLVLAKDASGPKRVPFLAVAGLFAGLAMITKPNFGIYLLFIMAWFLIFFDNAAPFKKRLGWALIFFALAAMPVLPITYRNYEKFNDFVLVSDSYGRMFYNGNGGNATGFFPQNLDGQNKTPKGVVDPDRSHVFFRDTASKIVGKNLLPSESAKFWFKAGLRDLEANPVRAARLFCHKFALFFHGYENHLVDSAYWKYQNILKMPFLPYSMISCLAILGMLLCAKKIDRLFLIYGLLFAFLCSGLIFMINSRYRAPGAPALCLFAGAAVHYMAGYLKQKKIRAFVTCLVFLSIIFTANTLAFKQTTAAHDRSYQPDPTYNTHISFHNSLGMKFVWIKPGTFMMGSPPDEPGRYNDETRRQVTLTRGYYMQTTEITQGQWKQVMGRNPSHFKNNGDNCPVETVSWDQVQEFIRKLNKIKGVNKYRLPTEAQWEFACRAGNSKLFCFKNKSKGLGQYAWYNGNSNARPHLVAGKQANAWGLYDMHGNVYEWCQDWYADYPFDCGADPFAHVSGTNRVIRGGSWFGLSRYCRSAFRDRLPPGMRCNDLGFRLAMIP